MSTDTAPQAPRSLFPGGALPARTRPDAEQVAPRAASAEANRRQEFAETKPSSARDVAPRVSPTPRAEESRQVSTPAPTRAEVPTPSKPAAPMHAELKQPLGELVQRRTSQDFARVFVDLVGHGVSDVHMTRSGVDKSVFSVEARIDGKMQLVHDYRGVEATTIGNLIKTDSKMTSDDNLVPEDGSYPLTIADRPYRARAVALPRHDGGERIVFRLPQTGAVRSLSDLGFTATNLAAITECLDIPGGMTLFVGPTGEGKSNTAQSALKYLQDQENGVIITLEDPVERVMAGITQIEVNEDVPGAGFSEMMKYVVRSDPNVLFIGEIRDKATATAAVEIAKSGIRVIATLHATDNASAFLRLIGMADDTPLAVLESINGIISQRLVPRLVAGTDRFSGRYPVNEVTLNSDALTDALIANTSRTAIRAAAAATSTTFKDNVDELVRDGITTLAEARKVVRYV